MRSRLTGNLRLQYPVPTAPAGALEGLLLAPPDAAAEALSSAPRFYYDPPLAPRDEAVYLLHVAAEVEQALMVQYLYAAFSLRPTGAGAAWRQELLKIAREEMGHLLTVQNLIRFLGGPLNFQREDYPFRSEVYPFPFRLERVTKNVLAKYVVAEMPWVAAGQLPPLLDQAGYDEVLHRAKLADPGNPLNHVGPLYADIKRRFAEVLTDLDVDADSLSLQGGLEWNGGHPSLVIQTIASRDQAVAAIDAIALQGEGPMGAADADSHYRRFLEIYQAFPEDEDGTLTHAVPTDPTATKVPDPDNGYPGRITHPQARLWAQLANQRYRMLLLDLAHSLHLPTGPDQDALRGWCLAEMGHLAQIAGFLAELPQGNGSSDGRVAGLPFELPYSLELPSRDRGRWLLQRDMLDNTKSLTSQLLNGVEQDPDRRRFLTRLQDRDALMLHFIIAPHLTGQDPTPIPAAELSFEKHIRPLFRKIDVDHMGFRGTDLDTFAGVRDNAGLIEIFLEDSMPPDALWPQSLVRLFSAWAVDPRE